MSFRHSRRHNSYLQEKKISKGKIPGDCDNANKVREERKQYRVALKKKMRMEKERQVIKT